MFAYTVVIRGLCNEMKLDMAEDAFFGMQIQGLTPDVYTYGALIGGLFRAGNLIYSKLWIFMMS